MRKIVNLFENNLILLYNLCMKNLKEIISKNITILRKSRKMTQSDLAKKLNYSNKMVSKWENGDILPGVEILILLSEIFNVSLDVLVHPIEEVENVKEEEKQAINKRIIALLAITPVWVLATIVFVYANIIDNFSAWTVFIWAIPISCIIGIIFNSIWGKRKLNYVIISIFIWSMITAIYLQFLKFNLFPLYFLGIPLQISVLLWSKLRIKNKQ